MQAEIIYVGANTALVCTLQMSTVLRVLKIPRVVLGKESPGVTPLSTHQPFSSDSAQMYRLL